MDYRTRSGRKKQLCSLLLIGLILAKLYFEVAMKYVLSFLIFVFSPFAPAQVTDGGSVGDLINSTQNTAFKNLMDASEYDNKNITMVKADESKIMKSQHDIDQALERGKQYYKKGDYEQAYPLISELAIMGIKDPQMLLGMMFLEGQYVTKSTVRGMGWLGVANEGKLNHSRKVFNHVYKQLSDEHKQVIDTTVADYRAKYGMDVQNIVCKKKKPVGSNLETTICAKRADSESPWHAIQ